MSIDYKNYIGSEFVNSLGYTYLLKFEFYDPIKQHQTIALNFSMWKIILEFKFLKTIKAPPSIYIPFYTAGLKQIIINKN